MKNKWIPLSSPSLIGNEKKYVEDCLETTWISSNGKYVEEFEKSFAKQLGVKQAISCCNGTTALHVALLALGVKPGDEILVPTFTFIATVNAVTYCGATPVFVDSDPFSWNMDPKDAEKKMTSKTKGIIPVHLYGYPCDMDKIISLSKKHQLFVLEDAAEALGALWGKKWVGSVGDIGIFSFFGNKIITTGEGGMLTTNDSEIASKIRLLKGQGQEPTRRYWYPIIGYNYRMTNIAAAIGLAQLEKFEWHLAQRRRIGDWYRKSFSQDSRFVEQKAIKNSTPIDWMYTLILSEEVPLSRDEVMKELEKVGIETRPCFYPIHTLPPYQHLKAYCPVAEKIALRGLNLPTWAGLTQADLSYIVEQVRKIIPFESKLAA